MLTDELLRANLHAGVRWSKSRDLPDPVGWQDLTFADDLSIAVMRDRLDSGAWPGRVHVLPIPKGYGEELRQMTVLDPFDEVIYRGLVGLAADSIDDSLGDEVRSYRLDERPPGWTVRNHQYAWHVQRAEVRAYAESPDFAGMATFDVRHYYPSIARASLAGVLATVGTSDEVVTEIKRFLDGLSLWGMRDGVPVGPEASGLLGNIYLISLDERIRATGLTFSRYTDDYKVQLRGPRSFAPVIALARDELERLGLQMHPDKTKHLSTPAFTYTELYDRKLDAVATLLDADPDLGLLAVKRMFEAEATSKAPTAKRVKYCLGVLRHRRDDFAVTYAQTDPLLLRVDPRAWGSYLAPLYGSRRLDRDWMVELAAATPTAQTAGVQLQLLLACSNAASAKSAGKSFEELATTASADWIPVRCAAAEAWGRSEAWKAGTAAEAVMTVGDTQHRRALTLTLRRTGTGKKRNQALRQLHTVAPECRPSVKWIEERADRAA